MRPRSQGPYKPSQLGNEPPEGVSVLPDAATPSLSGFAGQFPALPALLLWLWRQPGLVVVNSGLECRAVRGVRLCLATTWPCDNGCVIQLLWASVSPPIKWG